MRDWVVTDEGHRWTVKLDVRDLGGHLDTTFRGWSSTLATRVRLVIARVVVVFALPLPFHGRLGVLRNMFILGALHGVEASFLAESSVRKLRSAFCKVAWSRRQPFAHVGTVLGLLDGPAGCDPAFCVVWFRFRLMRRYLAFRPEEVPRVYRLLQAAAEGSPGHGPAHLLLESAAELGTNNQQPTTNNNQQPTTTNNNQQQPTTHNQHTTNTQPTTTNNNQQQPTTHDTQHTTHNTRHTTHDTQHTTNNQQPTTNNQQHTTHNTTTPQQHHNNTTTTPQQHHNNTTTAPQQHHNNTTTTQAILRVGPIPPVSDADFVLARTGDLGLCFQVVLGLHRRLSDFLHAVAVRRREVAIRGWRDWLREDPLVNPYKWLRPDLVPPAPVLQCDPAVTPGVLGFCLTP